MTCCYSKLTPTEFGEDSHPKFAPTPRLPIFLVDHLVGIHYPEGCNFSLELLEFFTRAIQYSAFTPS